MTLNRLVSIIVYIPGTYIRSLPVCGSYIALEINKKQEALKMIVEQIRNEKQTLKMFEFKARNIRNGNIRN